jgi:ABC-type transport system involved in cytochrome c biogenesis permease subunit
MGLGVGIFLIAVGAILTFAINADTNGAVNIDTVGWILMGVGLASVLLSMIFWSSWAGPVYLSRRRTTYVDDGPRATGPPY